MKNYEEYDGPEAADIIRDLEEQLHYLYGYISYHRLERDFNYFRSHAVEVPVDGLPFPEWKLDTDIL